MAQVINTNSLSLITQNNINKNNLRSAAILEKMGAKVVGETPSGKSLCYEGSIADLKNWTNLK